MDHVGRRSSAKSGLRREIESPPASWNAGRGLRRQPHNFSVVASHDDHGVVEDVVHDQPTFFPPCSIYSSFVLLLPLVVSFEPPPGLFSEPALFWRDAPTKTLTLPKQSLCPSVDAWLADSLYPPSPRLSPSFPSPHTYILSCHLTFSWRRVLPLGRLHRRPQSLLRRSLACHGKAIGCTCLLLPLSHPFRLIGISSGSISTFMTTA